MRVLQQGFSFGDRLAEQIGDGNRFRTQRRHQRDGGTLLERRPGHRVDARDAARRDVESVDAGGDLHLEPEVDQARLRVVHRRADQLRDVRVVGDQVRPRAPRGGGERDDQHQDPREPPEPATLRSLGTGDRLRGRGHQRHPFGHGAIAAHLGKIARQGGQRASGRQTRRDRLEVASHLGGVLRPELAIAIGGRERRTRRAPSARSRPRTTASARAPTDACTRCSSPSRR